jgi:hypothetical protein
VIVIFILIMFLNFFVIVYVFGEEIIHFILSIINMSKNLHHPQ